MSLLLKALHMPRIISVLKVKNKLQADFISRSQCKRVFLFFFFSMFSNTSQAGMFYFQYYVHSKVVQMYLLAWWEKEPVMIQSCIWGDKGENTGVLVCLLLLTSQGIVRWIFSCGFTFVAYFHFFTIHFLFVNLHFMSWSLKCLNSTL